MAVALVRVSAGWVRTAGAVPSPPVPARGRPDGAAVAGRGLAQRPSDGCAVDVAKPAAQWPDCADWTLVAQGRIVRTRLSGRRAPRRASEPFVLAAGDPRVLQEPATDNPGFYRFTAVRPLQSDRDGRITAAETWLVVCPPKADRGEPQIVIPGLRVAKAACYVRDGPALSKVLVRSGDWGLHQTMRWVRDGDR